MATWNDEQKKHAAGLPSAFDHQKTCPHCGYCSQCGRSNRYPYYTWPSGPYYPYGPYWGVSSYTAAGSNCVPMNGPGPSKFTSDNCSTTI